MTFLVCSARCCVHPTNPFGPVSQWAVLEPCVDPSWRLPLPRPKAVMAIKTREGVVYVWLQIVSVAKDEYEGKQLAPYEFPLLPSVPGKPRSKGATTRKFLVLEIGKVRARGLCCVCV
jgi:hypothetical protein